MAIPTQPIRFFPRPFAEGGNFQANIPDTAADAGRATYTRGFPTETQLPLASGGIAPNRLDFNGLFNILTAFGFWQQSGGQWAYSTKLNYKTPCIVFHDKKLWWCVVENGPDSANGIVTPGTDDAYWQEFLAALAEMGGTSSIGNPIGTVITYYGTTAPDGYFACDGSAFSATTYPQLYALLGSTILPDMRGYFVRGYDTRNTVDPDGARRAIGSTQTDAGRNVTGQAPLCDRNASFDSVFSGAFYVNTSTYDNYGSSSIDKDNPRCFFDASRVWGANHTSTEFRPSNIALLYCIKHD